MTGNSNFPQLTISGNHFPDAGEMVMENQQHLLRDHFRGATKMIEGGNDGRQSD